MREALTVRLTTQSRRNDRHASFSYLAAMIACTLCAMVPITVSAQSANDIRGPSALVAIENEPSAKSIFAPPLAEQLAKGLVFIQYRAENRRVVPVFGKGALTVSPRIGPVHITVDDNSWHFVDASGETVILVGLKPGAAQRVVRAGGSHAQSDHESDGEVRRAGHEGGATRLTARGCASDRSRKNPSLRQRSAIRRRAR